MNIIIFSVDSGEEQNVFNSPKSMSSIEEKEKENYEWVSWFTKNIRILFSA